MFGHQNKFHNLKLNIVSYHDIDTKWKSCPGLAIKEQEKMAIKTKLVTWTFFCLLCNVMTSVKVKGSVHSAIK